MPVQVHTVDHGNPHPSVYGPSQTWSAEQTVHLAVAYSNPFRLHRRRASALDCLRQLRTSPNVVVHVGEVAYGDRPFEVTSPDHPYDYQWRTTEVLFHKENILNLVVSRFPADWKYGAYVDADVTFTRHDWALETIHQLQMYSWVQMYSHYVDASGPIPLGNGHRPISHPNPDLHNSFAFNYQARGFTTPPGYLPVGWKDPSAGSSALSEYDAPVKARSMKAAAGKQAVGATGLAWAFTRNGFNVPGGLMDRCILGSGDWYMAFGLIGKGGPESFGNQLPSNALGVAFHPDYRSYIFDWQSRASELKANVGYVDQIALHHFHGAKRHRQYGSRDKILIKHQYSPYRDIQRDSQGVVGLASSLKDPGLRDDIRAYFLSRNEDDPAV
jgi:hypothetical protein